MSNLDIAAAILAAAQIRNYPQDYERPRAQAELWREIRDALGVEAGRSFDGPPIVGPGRHQ